jgi:hypothetical protein
MITLKNLFLLLLASSPVFGITFKGTFSYTYTSLSQEGIGVEVGDTFTGWYRYESDTIDGTFFGFGGPGSLSGEVNFPAHFNPYADNRPIDLSTQNPMLTVVDGVVTAFHWSPELGPVGVTMTESFFTMSDSFNPGSGRGTVSFSNPRPSSSVPDVGNTALLLAGAAASLFIGRRSAVI